MALKLSKLLAVGVAMIFAIIALLIVRFLTVARGLGPNTAVDVYWLLHSSWLILGIIAIVALGGWISYLWVFRK